MKLKLYIPAVVLMFVVGGVIPVSAQTHANWIKLGKKDVNFSIDHDTMGAERKGNITEIRMQVKNAPVKFTKVIINYKDGTKQELEYLEDVAVGNYSRSITIEGDGHPIKTIDFWYETDSLGGKKDKVTVYGRS